MTKTPEQQIAELKQSLAQAKQKKTLRDEFAMSAMKNAVEVYGVDRINDAVCFAYWVADAMIKERSK